MDKDSYYHKFASAYVRGKMPHLEEQNPEDLLRAGAEAGLRISRFKRTAELPRVRRVLGILRSVHPETVLDIGCGRGTFLWPLLYTFPQLQVTAIDRDFYRIREVQAVCDGGVQRLSALCADVSQLCFSEGSHDVVTMLEVLEHLRYPEKAVQEVSRIARRFVIVSVPSREDDNPEHIHRFTKLELVDLFERSGAMRVNCEYVLNHLVAVVRIR